MGSDAAKIKDEVIQHLEALQKDGVKVTIEIQATIPNDIPADRIQQSRWGHEIIAPTHLSMTCNLTFHS